jgi:ribonuclease T2
MWALLLISTAFAYDYNSLVVQWKPSQCALHSCVNGFLSNNFNIHGLWPDNWNGTYPSNCPTTDTFTITNSTKAILLECWLSYNPNVTDFWYHEWSKHGTCVTPSLICNDYFLDTANLFFALNIVTQFSSVGIVPSNSTKYQVSKALTAFSRNTTMNCLTDASKRVLLSEVTFCFDKSFNWINCRTTQKGCGVDFLMPSA